MMATARTELVCRKYLAAFGASARPDYPAWIEAGPGRTTAAALGYRRAGDAPLFLEWYLDRPVEALVSQAFGREIARQGIVEIGNFASDNALAMVELWGSAANDLSGSSEVAVATLTAPLRRMFARIGLPVIVLAPACPERLGEGAPEWGNYYAQDPQVCAGVIAEGQSAIASFLARRNRRAAA